MSAGLGRGSRNSRRRRKRRAEAAQGAWAESGESWGTTGDDDQAHADQPETAAEVGEDTGPLNAVQDLDEPSYARPYLGGAWGDQGDAGRRADWHSTHLDEQYDDPAYGDIAHADAGLVDTGLADAGQGDAGAQGAAGDVLDDGWRSEGEAGSWPDTAAADQWNGAEAEPWGAEGIRAADEQPYAQPQEQLSEQDYDLSPEQGLDQAYGQGDGQAADAGVTERWTADGGEGDADQWGDARQDDPAEGDSSDSHWSDPEEWHRTRYGDEPAEPRTGFLGSGWRDDPEEAQGSRPKRRSGKLLAVAAVAVLGVALGGIWLFSGSGDKTPVASDRVPTGVVDSGLPDDSELLGEPTSGPTDGTTGEPTVQPTVESTSTPAQPDPRSTTRQVRPTHEPATTRASGHTRQPRTTTSHPAPQNSTFSGSGDPQHTSGSTQETTQRTSDPQPQVSSPPGQDDIGDTSGGADSGGGSGSGGGSSDDNGGGGGGGGGLLGWLFGR
jgi:hypothetical protein